MAILSIIFMTPTFSATGTMHTPAACPASVVSQLRLLFVWAIFSGSTPTSTPTNSVLLCCSLKHVLLWVLHPAYVRYMSCMHSSMKFSTFSTPPKEHHIGVLFYLARRRHGTPWTSPTRTKLAENLWNTFERLRATWISVELACGDTELIVYCAV